MTAKTREAGSGGRRGFVLALAIFFAVQVRWSVWWLRRHEQGPLERLWSRVTYGRVARTPLAAAQPTPGA